MQKGSSQNGTVEVPPENAARRARENLEELGLWISRRSEEFEQLLAKTRHIQWCWRFFESDRNTAYENVKARWTQWGYWDPTWTELPGKVWRHERSDKTAFSCTSNLFAYEETCGLLHSNVTDSMIFSDTAVIPDLPQEQRDWSFLPLYSDTNKSHSNQSNVHCSLSSPRDAFRETLSIRAQSNSKKRRPSSPQSNGRTQTQSFLKIHKSPKARKRKRGFDAPLWFRRSARIAARIQQPKESTSAMCAAGPVMNNAKVSTETAKSSLRDPPPNRLDASQAQAKHQIGISPSQDYSKTRRIVPPAPPVLKTLPPPPLNMVWPHRLLHVPSMTSFVRHGFDIYNNVTAPSYNIISYTWGNFVDPSEAPIRVIGIDWPVPSIKSDHFSAASFQTAIERAARGFKHRCDWLWVDIACIPQWHPDETAEAKHLRDQEINRQVQIFRRARENFAWLSHLRVLDLSPVLPLVTWEDIYEQYSSRRLNWRNNAFSANEYLKGCNEVTANFDNWIRNLFAHPYFSSLWTLQEMTLRTDSWILLDDGLIPQFTNLGNLVDEVELAIGMLPNSERVILEAEEIVRVGNLIPECTCKKLWDRMNGLRSLQECKGLMGHETQIPHHAYSLAQHRNASRLIDRIYGIVQTYDITCDPDPKGDTEEAKLRNLEDEFGIKLVAKTAFVSQLFIHNSAPRRSWLVTPKCTVSHRWRVFSDRQYEIEERASLVVSEQTKDLEFRGRAWHLFSLLDSTVKDQAIMLDDHVAEEVFGQPVDRFKDRKSMKEAGERLFLRYGRSVRVALLAGARLSPLSHADFVGLLVAPLGEFEESPPWVRIGLFWWREASRSAHKDIPVAHHSFQCLIK